MSGNPTTWPIVSTPDDADYITAILNPSGNSVPVEIRIPGSRVRRALASQAQAEAGSDNEAVMTPLRVAQAIAELAGEASGGTLVAVSESDTTPGTLTGKLVAGNGISLTVGDEGGDETLTVTNTGDGAGGGGLQQVIEELAWDSATEDLDWSTSPFKVINLSADVDTQTFSNTPSDGTHAEMHLRIVQDATGYRDITPHASINWTNGIPDFAGMGPNQVAFVTLQVDDGGTVYGVSTVPTMIRFLTGDHTLELSDVGKQLRFASATDVTLTIPDWATVVFPKGPICVIHQRDAGAVIISAPSTLYSKGGADRTNGAGSGGGLSYQGTNTWWLTGNITTAP